MTLTRSFAATKRKIIQTKRVLPKILANQAQNYFVNSWRMQGFDGDKWQQVNRRIPDTNEYKYPKKKGLSRHTKPILVGTGRLRRKVANSVVVADWNKIKLVVDLVYAAVHNEGNDTTPQRQFIGQTATLTKMQKDTIERFFNKVWV